MWWGNKQGFYCIFIAEPTMKELRKLVNICQSYALTKVAYFFDSQCICTEYSYTYAHSTRNN